MIFPLKFLKLSSNSVTWVNARSPVKLLISVFSYSALRLRSQHTPPRPSSKIVPGSGTKVMSSVNPLRMNGLLSTSPFSKVPVIVPFLA